MIPLGHADQDEFPEVLEMAIRELFQLVFERRALDLHEDQTYALYVLTDFQTRLKNSRLWTSHGLAEKLKAETLR